MHLIDTSRVCFSVNEHTTKCSGFYNSCWINTLRPKQNDRQFPNDIVKWIFLNENVWMSIKISLKFVPKVPINNIPALVQIMAWHRTGDKPLSEPMMAQFNDAYMRHSASMSEWCIYHIYLCDVFCVLCPKTIWLHRGMCDNKTHYDYYHKHHYNTKQF